MMDEIIDKMTNEQVLRILDFTERCVANLFGRHTGRIAMRLCKKAVDKQIPVKCERITETWGSFHEEIWRCPKCRKDAIRGGFYCWNCGQRLDWGDKDGK